MEWRWPTGRRNDGESLKPDRSARIDRRGGGRLRGRRRLVRGDARGVDDIAAEVHLAAVALLVADGRHPVIVGQPDHPEVRGLTEDLAAFDIVVGEGDIERLLSGVLKVRMQAVDKARSSATLGATREGSGVLIDDQGHVLTIGYLVSEAQSIELTTQAGKLVPARLVAYDHPSGLGLLLISPVLLLLATFRG